MKELSVTEYAKNNNISRQAVLKKIKKGQLDARKVGNSYIIKTK